MCDPKAIERQKSSLGLANQFCISTKPELPFYASSLCRSDAVWYRCVFDTGELVMKRKLAVSIIAFLTLSGLVAAGNPQTIVDKI